MIEKTMMQMLKKSVNRLQDYGYTQMQIAQMLFDTDELCRETKHYNLFGTKLDDEAFYLRYSQYVKNYIDENGKDNIIDNDDLVKDIMLRTLENIDKDEHGFRNDEFIKREMIHKKNIDKKCTYYSYVNNTLVVNYKSAKTDNELTPEEKYNIFRYTIKKLEDLVDHIYIDEKNKNKFIEVTINMREMLNRKNGLSGTFQTLMTDIGANCVLLDYKSKSYYYPVLLDIILDVFRLKVLAVYLKDNADILYKNHYALHKLIQNNHIQVNKNISGLAELFSTIDSRQVVPYVIELYSRKLNTNYDDMRKLYIYLSFGSITGSSKYFPKISREIPSARHLMFHHVGLIYE